MTERRPITTTEISGVDPVIRGCYKIETQKVINKQLHIQRICKFCKSKKWIKVNTIREALKYNKLSGACGKCSGKRNAGIPRRGEAFKGGFIYKDGYKHIIPPKNHPNKGTSFYMPEHRLIMEAHLGRYLTSEETVHHKNKIRDDNRIENLELWTGAQPSGARVKDLLEWAKEIINQYEHEQDKL